LLPLTPPALAILPNIGHAINGCIFRRRHTLTTAAEQLLLSDIRALSAAVAADSRQPCSLAFITESRHVSTKSYARRCQRFANSQL
jgi:hypothetical protein